MGTPRRGSFRLMIVSAAAAGVVLAVPVAANADDSAPIEPAPTELAPPDVSPPAEPADTPTTTDVASDLPSASDVVADEVIADESVAGPLAIDLIIEETPQPDPPSDGDQASDEPTPAAPTTAAATLEEPTGGEGGHTGGETGTDGEDGHTGGEGGHTGGGGQGDPYRITFSVTWYSPADKMIMPDDLPAELREMFELSAASATGSGKPTAAHCTYPSGGSELICEFENPGHGSGPDGMVVPKKKTATYTVTVVWNAANWTIENANAGPYSAWDLCPRGGGEGSGGSHGGGEAMEGETGGDTFVCNHVVVMRQVVASAGPPITQPASVEPTASGERIPTTPPEVAPAAPPAAQVASAGPRTLPATGNQAQTTLLIGALILSIGGCLSLLARRRTSPPMTG